MQKRNKLAAIVNTLGENELANLSPNAALSLLHGLRQQPCTGDTDRALKRLATHLLRQSQPNGDDSLSVPLVH